MTSDLDIYRSANLLVKRHGLELALKQSELSLVPSGGGFLLQKSEQSFLSVELPIRNTHRWDPWLVAVSAPLKSIGEVC